MAAADPQIELIPKCLSHLSAASPQLVPMTFGALPHFLVPTNFGAPARRAQQRALQLALKQDARLTLLHVSPSPWQSESPAGLAAIELLHETLRRPHDPAAYLASHTTHEALLRASALQRLAREVHPEWLQSVEVQMAWRRGDVVEQILTHAREETVDAIVLGIGRAGWLRIWPNLAERILRRAPCEVILVSDPPSPRAAGLAGWLPRWWHSRRGNSRRPHSPQR